MFLQPNMTSYRGATSLLQTTRNIVSYRGDTMIIIFLQTNMVSYRGYIIIYKPWLVTEGLHNNIHTNYWEYG